MPGWVGDLLTPKDLWEDVPVPREGTDVTAVRDDPGDGPVRPGFQTLANQGFWLRTGIVDGRRTLTSAHLAVAGGGRPSGARPGELLCEADAWIRGTARVRQDVISDNSVQAGTFVTAKIAGSANLFWRTGPDTGGAALYVLQDHLQWDGVGFGKANPPLGDVLRHGFFLKQVVKCWGHIEIQSGVIISQSGAGGWKAEILELDPGKDDRTVVRISFLPGEEMDDGKYCLEHNLATPVGEFKLVSTKCVFSSDKFFDLTAWHSEFAVGAVWINWLDLKFGAVNFSVLGVQS